MDTQNIANRLHDIMALADAHAYAKIMPGTPREQYPYFFLRAEIQSLLAENETLRHKLQTLDELGGAGDDVQLLRMGYAAARLEIASLQGRVNECGAGAGCCAQAARIAELEAQLEAVGAGGVGPLVGAPAQPVAQWVPVSERLPEPGEAVLLDIGMQTPIRALWAAKHTVETNDDDGEWGEYNEDDDAYYCPEGWYEWNEYEECHFAVDKGAPVAWMELPLPGKVAAPQLAAQAQEDAVAQAVAAEREACAQVCITQAVAGQESWQEQKPKRRDLVSEAYRQSAIMAQQGCAAAIRARGTDAAKPTAQALDSVRVFWQQHTQADALSMTMAELHDDVELVIRAARGAAQAAPRNGALAAPAQPTVAPTHQQIADYLTASGAWVTNEATRDAAIAQEHARKPLHPVEAMRLILNVEQNYSHMRGTTNWAVAVARAIEAAHGITEPDQPESMPLTKDEIVSMAIEAERRACTAACEKVKQQAKATANSSFVTDAGKDVHNAMAAGAQNCIAAIAARGSNGH